MAIFNGLQFTLLRQTQREEFIIIKWLNHRRYVLPFAALKTKVSVIGNFPTHLSIRIRY